MTDLLRYERHLLLPFRQFFVLPVLIGDEDDSEAVTFMNMINTERGNCYLPGLMNFLQLPRDDLVPEFPV